jgi:peroxiredoxin
MLRNRDKAPEFALVDESGVSRSLGEIRGEGALALVFVRFAGCPTTRRDLMAYADAAGRVRSLGAEIATVTADTPGEHRMLVDRLDLPFRVLSDPGLTVSRQYGVYESDETDEGPQPHGEPAVCVIDVDGNVAYSQACSGPKGLLRPEELAMVLLYMHWNGGRYW